MAYAVERIAKFFPHVSPSEIEQRLRYSTFVNFDRHYLYYEVPKAACTAMKTMIHHLEGLPPIKPFVGPAKQVRREMFIHDRTQFALKSIIDFDDKIQEQILNSDAFLRLTIVRNPYPRLVSAWRARVLVCAAPAYINLYERIKGALPRSGAPESFISFADFVEFLATDDLRLCDAHWRLQVEHSFHQAMNFNYVGRVEAFKDAVAVFLEAAGFSPDQSLVPMNESTGRSPYDEKLAERVYQLYARDFEAFGYSKESWEPRTTAERSATISEERFLEEITERNIVISHLYIERNALRDRFAQYDRMDHQSALEAYRTAGFEDLFSRFVSMIDGSLAKDEAAYLYELAEAATEGAIVEVGSHRGRSTATLAFGTIAGQLLPVYAIEPHEPFIGEYGSVFAPVDRGHFMKTMVQLGLYHCVRLVNLSSELLSASWSIPISLLRIDGDHRYPAVKHDFEHWRRHLSDGATVVFDDAVGDSESARLVRELIAAGEFIIDKTVGKMVGLKKIART